MQLAVKPTIQKKNDLQRKTEKVKSKKLNVTLALGMYANFANLTFF